MAGKHRAESSSSNTMIKVAGLAGIAVTASLMSAGSAQAAPFGLPDGFKNLFNAGAAQAAAGSSSATTAANNISKPAFGIFGPSTNNFFTNPNPNPGAFGYGSFITKTNPPSTSGLEYVTTPGRFQITGFCLNSKGCN
jgi:hypothetical protein